MSMFSEEAQTPQPWLRETVQSFFQAVAWDGRSPLTSLGLGATARSESTMTMTVGDFFQNIAWDGQPTIGVPISPLAAATTPAADPNLDLTLDGFSDLFG